jgi:hypothetical protein
MACEERVVEQRCRVIDESKRKRNREGDGSFSEASVKAAKLKRDAAHTALLCLPMHTEMYCNIQDLRKKALSTMNLIGPV